MLMRATDSNNATWYVLRYPSDFTPRTDPAIAPWMSPELEPTLLYDTERHVLELLPGTPAADADPLPGLAVDLDGRVYIVDPATGRVLVRCAGIERELVRERGAIASAAGMAVDRRGLLYIADPPARRVLAVRVADGSLAGIIADGLVEPIDVAVSHRGRIVVADRSGGRVVVFDGRFDRCGSFVAADLHGVITAPRPIVVMVDADDALLVADAKYPRLLRFTLDGRLLGEVEPHALARRADVSTIRLDSLDRAYAGLDDDCDRLAAVHRALRLLRMSLRHDFAPCGTFVSAALDGGSPGIEWHKVVIDADVPDGTWLKVQTVTDDDPDALGTPASIPTIAEDEDVLDLTAPAFVPFEDPDCAVGPRMTDAVPDRLVFSPAGRYLRLKLTLGSDGSATPSVRSVRVFYPRTSYLDLLPRAYRRDAHSALFLEHFLALFEQILTRVEDRYELFTRQLDPDAAPLDVINWLACLIDLSFDPSWPLERRRALVAAAMELYATRGTPRGLARFIEIYTGMRPVILEAFLERPVQAPALGRTGVLLGASTLLGAPRRVAPFAHRFTVLVFIDDACDEAVTVPVVDRIVSVNKPAHTVHTLEVVRAGARVGSARVGVDVMLGGCETTRTRVGGCTIAGGQLDAGAVLGGDSILGDTP